MSSYGIKLYVIQHYGIAGFKGGWHGASRRQFLPRPTERFAAWMSGSLNATLRKPRGDIFSIQNRHAQNSHCYPVDWHFWKIFCKMMQLTLSLARYIPFGRLEDVWQWLILSVSVEKLVNWKRAACGGSNFFYSSLFTLLKLSPNNL